MILRQITAKKSALGKWLSAVRKFSQPHFREADIWRICLSQESSVGEKLFDLLSPDERARAGKYFFKKEQMRFIITRGAVREILSSYLNVAPNRLCFSYNRYGKPVLDERKHSCQLHFNVSRSRDIALCAVMREQEIGVDIEFINKENAGPEVADLFFSANEAASLNAFPANGRTAAFFRCWTRKEAYVKAVGKGLSYPLHDFSVSVGTEKITSPEITGAYQKTPRWSLTTFSPHPEYVAALAAGGPPPRLVFREWTKFFE